jgi:acetyl-CoA acetyltransferase
MVGAPTITGPTVSQACATSARALVTAELEVRSGQRDCVLVLAADRTSNGPHVYYPDPGAPGGQGKHENPVMDSFGHDPWAKVAMVDTAEAVASEEHVTREQQDAMTLLRYEQYRAALADDREFQRRYMIDVELKRRGKVVGRVSEDEGIHETTAEGLARLRPVVPQGIVTYGAQTHPADGNSGLILCSEGRARELQREPIPVRLLAWGDARVEKGRMPKASIPAARAALRHAGLGIEAMDAIKTHNPFAVNDVLFCREMGVQPEAVNRYGSPLIWGHPQGPTGLRAVIELVEELAERGGGLGLFTGCAAGDTAMALVVRVG